MKVGVVIPFYQRSAGILPRALDSIREQVVPSGVQLEVVIVDDQSPIPAAEEMAGYNDDERIRWHRLKQPNSGPGAARNTGIDWLDDKNIEYLAFLDSDDEWRPDHLANALAALEAGGDFYFSDHSRAGDCKSYFNEDRNVRATMRGIAALPAMGASEGVRLFPPNAINHAMLENYLSQTSTVVLRRSALGSMRFDPELRDAGEDYMLWLRLALSGARICISDRIGVVCGTGINMYHSSYDWGSTGILTRLSSEIVFHRKLDRLPLGDAREKVQEKFRECRRLYAYLLMKRAAKRTLPAKTGLSKVMRHDPLLVAQAPLLTAQFMLRDRRRLATSDSM